MVGQEEGDGGEARAGQDTILHFKSHSKQSVTASAKGMCKHQKRAQQGAP